MSFHYPILYKLKVNKVERVHNSNSNQWPLKLLKSLKSLKLSKKVLWRMFDLAILLLSLMLMTL
ncbi:hypothetical protein PVK06_046262 [Gossypium arboreum]|uniref:Uncharacterized protein n=1 Tax=Gossypium arboreum TaxID=29729 RepID=A0ABR0MA01_GOSAR|nr:hypothetical protein PVK06_046262 [Gossypium arboreum]